MEERDQIRKKANRHFYIKAALIILLIILGALLLGASLRQIQIQAAFSKQTRNSELALNEAVEILSGNADDATDLAKIYHDSNQDMTDDLCRLLTGGVFESLMQANVQNRAEVFDDMVERSGADYVFILKENGQVFLASAPELYGKDLIQLGLMTQENLEKLMKGTLLEDGTVDVVLQNNYYCYSSWMSYGSDNYILVIGVDASDLDNQVGLLRDQSKVLRGILIGNDGFLFAVDLEKESFLFFENDGVILTGRSIHEAGLSPAALQNGYHGVETICGVRYYCVTMGFGSTTISAVAEMGKILEHNKAVLFASMLGFFLVMLLCFSYAIIVRNDFVRNAVETKKRYIPGWKDVKIVFDVSIFRKVFPLMLVGVVLIFVISFYTQTLLEISEGIEKSSVALEGMSFRYQDNQKNREIIEEDYSSRFLSKAEVIAYLLEEDPSILNEPTVRRYTIFDENSERQYLLDDEGNPLRSVSVSSGLKELCEANDLKSIYVFNEDGRTIATSSDAWFFVISHNPEDQSYEFLQILEGKSDTVVQELQVSDLGIPGKFIGVAFNYYTTLDEAGNTVYISRSDYQRSDEREAVSRKITPHRSLLQIELEANLSDRLLASSNTGLIFASDVLEGGAVMLFDSAPEHFCIYSPYEENIGKTAEELGVSRKAFSVGNYYGFTELNGISSFLCCRYDNGQYIATAIPKNSMYQSRTGIAFKTALSSLILIVFLTCAVTLTTEEEEQLYSTMSDEQAEKGFNSAMFSIILPSGRRTSTKKAAARWDNARIPWNEQSPEQKLLFLVGIMFGILLLYMSITILGARSFFSEGSVVLYILNGAWDRGINIFALSDCILLLVFTALVVALFRIFVRTVTSLLGTKSETIGHLLISFVRYGGAIGAIFYCLYLIGMDASGLLASAGVFSLIIGLGAQSLIKDIIAGIFIVFEGEFRVGDIVTIADYRGTVMDIGLRTTKVLGIDGNIKIFNNSEISGVLNMTKEASFAICKISIEYGQDINYVEAVLQRDLPALREKDPRILDGPNYVGVSALGESGVELMVLCRCNEKDVKSVGRYMNREILQIFYDNSITVPFRNVTISGLEVEERKTMADYREPEKNTLNGPEGKKVKSESITVTESGEGIHNALRMTERLGRERDLSRKNTLQLRLLAEELFGMLRGIAGNVNSTYWTETNGKNCELHLSTRLPMTREMREQLLSVSTSGKNEAANGFIGNIRDLIYKNLLPSASSQVTAATELEAAEWASPYQEYTSAESYEWSMNEYLNNIENRRASDEATEGEWDEMEKSVVEKLADEIKISMKGSRVEIVAYKSLTEDGNRTE